MTKRDARLRLRDILEAIDEAAEYLDGMEFGAYERDRKTRRSIERCIEIVSEASRHLPHELTARHPEIPWNEVRAIGNKMRHEYQHVSDHVIWRTAAKSLPELKCVVLLMLQELGEDRAH